MPGAAWDFSTPAAARQLRGWIAAGFLWGIHFGVPCNTWTRARDRGPIKPAAGGTGWPSRLRSDKDLWGLPTLCFPPDVSKVEMSNRLVKNCISVWQVCVRREVPMTIENPGRSRLWLIPFLGKAAQRPHFSLATTHYCMDGCAWTKPTTFRSFRVNLSAVPKQCSGAQQCCDRTGKQHQVLSGRSPAGPLWT